MATLRRFDVQPVLGYPHDYGLMLAQLQDGTREWREELEEVGVDTIVRQAYPGGYSIGGIMLHIAEVEIYWLEEFCLDQKMSEADEKLFMSNDIQQYEGKWPDAPREPLSYYYKVLDDVRARTFENVKHLPPHDVFKSRPNEEVSMGWVFSHVIGHESYHGGQIVLLKEMFKRM